LARKFSENSPPLALNCFSRSLHQLLAVSELILSDRREVYSALAVERLGGFMTTYFITLPDPGQPYPFFYTFPYGYEDMLKNKQRKGSLKVKRRSTLSLSLPTSLPSHPHVLQMVCARRADPDLLQVEIPTTDQRPHSHRPLSCAAHDLAILPTTPSDR
jgi:hypothetical protein